MNSCYRKLETTLNIIGGKWKCLILYHLSEGPRRTSELQTRLPDCSQKMLIQSLRELEDDGLVRRKTYNQVPPKVEYSLTALGESLQPVLTALVDWGEHYLESVSE